MLPLAWGKIVAKTHLKRYQIISGTYFFNALTIFVPLILSAATLAVISIIVGTVPPKVCLDCTSGKHSWPKLLRWLHDPDTSHHLLWKNSVRDYIISCPPPHFKT